MLIELCSQHMMSMHDLFKVKFASRICPSSLRYSEMWTGDESGGHDANRSIILKCARICKTIQTASQCTSSLDLVLSSCLVVEP